MIQPGQYDITIQRRGDFDISFQLKDSDSVPVDLNGSVVEAQIWSTHRRDKLLDFTVNITDEGLGKFMLKLTEIQTEQLPDTCVYDIRVTDSLGSSYYWVRGTVTVEMGYTE